MKKLITLSLILFLGGLDLKAQDNSSSLSYAIETQPSTTGTDFLEKSKKQKIAAWIFFGSGTVLSGLGAFAVSKVNKNTIDPDAVSEENRSDLSTIMIAAGVGCLLTSIPYFISSSFNKSRANLSFKKHKTGMAVPPGFSKEITSLCLSIPIGN